MFQGPGGSVTVGRRLVPGLMVRCQPEGRLADVPAVSMAVQKIVIWPQGMFIGRVKLSMGFESFILPQPMRFYKQGFVAVGRLSQVIKIPMIVRQRSLQMSQGSVAAERLQQVAQIFVMGWAQAIAGPFKTLRPKGRGVYSICARRQMVVKTSPAEQENICPGAKDYNLEKCKRVVFYVWRYADGFR